VANADGSTRLSCQFMPLLGHLFVSDLPPLTHSANGQNGMSKYTTPRNVLENIPRNSPNNELCPRIPGKQYEIWDDTKLLGCITCNHTVTHPSGRRECTLREVAALAGYPHNHVFKGDRPQSRTKLAIPAVCCRNHFQTSYQAPDES
jgi:site-specific DNA-cytosine methylase